ncbi:hypothetical protein GJAV_G00256140 [Gymnothorax javanicus]|nr:hypothetical protein GJAV_G00256140 [Gymnothorax javanicus]
MHDWTHLQDFYTSGCSSRHVQPSTEKTTNWELKYVKFDGVPFQLVGTRVYGCHLGKDKNVRQEKYHAKKQGQGESLPDP